MAAIPKPASTVVLMDNEKRVLLTKRPETMKFMAGFYVFPGGSMDEMDHQVNKQFIHGESENDSLTMGHYIAAARELFEEVGVLLCNTADGSAVALTQEQVEFYRSQLLQHEITFGNLLEKEEIYFKTDFLAYMGQVITPKQSPVRFDTRFFLATLPQGQAPHLNESEIVDAFWMTPEDTLTLFKKKEIKIAPPTIAALEAMETYKNGDKLYISEARVQTLAAEFFKSSITR